MIWIIFLFMLLYNIHLTNVISENLLKSYDEHFNRYSQTRL